MANQHVLNNSLIITGSVSASAGFYGDGTGLTGITAVAEWDGSRNGDASITGSLIISGSSVNVDFINTTGVSGSFSGSFSGDGSELTNLSFSLPPNIVSGSGQISYTGITDIPANIVSSSAQFITLTNPFTGSFTGSFVGDGSGLTSLTLPSNLVSGSGQISYTGITDIPANIISSSAQFISLANPFTGSFTGSFTGDGSGLTGVTATATGEIFQTGSNTGAIKPNNLNFNSISSGQYSTVIGGNNATASADYATVLGGSCNKATQTYALAGGQRSTATGVGAIALGICNTTSGDNSVTIGGSGGTTLGNCSILLGGKGSIVSGSTAAIIGGGENIITATGISSAIIGGESNIISGRDSAIVGGISNYTAHTGSVVLGGTNISSSRDYQAVVQSLTVTGNTGDITGNYTGIIQLVNRDSTPSGSEAGMLMVSGSDSAPNLYFYTDGGWVKINP